MLSIKQNNTKIYFPFRISKRDFLTYGKLVEMAIVSIVLLDTEHWKLVEEIMNYWKGTFRFRVNLSLLINWGLFQLYKHREKHLCIGFSLLVLLIVSLIKQP